ncbi:MAG: PrsW family glutamic-type intramembrane protease [Cyclobacteriaceae bacterium]|nr:PrsW family glutamic-type intramembrane protease [Cyclobacteriaceae bacterium]
MNILTLIAVATAPGFAIGLFIYLSDKYEKEPILLLTKSFGFGVLSALLTLGLSTLLYFLIPPFDSTLSDQFMHAFLAVALIEEFSKYIFLRYAIFPNKEFNEPFDGIVYAVFVGMGFATFENILYVLDGGMDVAISRMFTAVPAHGTFGVLMGYFMGNAKIKYKNPRWGLLGLLAAVLFHGSYDFFLFISHIPGIYVGTLFALVLGIYFSRKAIRMHQNNSPFRKKPKQEEPL